MYQVGANIVFLQLLEEVSDISKILGGHVILRETLREVSDIFHILYEQSNILFDTSKKAVVMTKCVLYLCIVRVHNNDSRFSD